LAKDIFYDNQDWADAIDEDSRIDAQDPLTAVEFYESIMIVDHSKDLQYRIARVVRLEGVASNQMQRIERCQFFLGRRVCASRMTALSQQSPPRDAHDSCVLNRNCAEVFGPYANSTRVNLARLHRVRRQVRRPRCSPRRRVGQHRLPMGCSQLGGVREGRPWRDWTSSSLNGA
jgi:hypothetical protein